MTPTEVLKMLKSKIDAAGLNKCNYVIETSDIEAINQALLLYDVSGSFPSRKWLMDVIDEVVDTNQTLGSANIADGIIERWKGNEPLTLRLQMFKMNNN